MSWSRKALFTSFYFSLRFENMAKRIAEKELTDRNWDQEDEAEEVRSFPRTISCRFEI